MVMTLFLLLLLIGLGSQSTVAHSQQPIGVAVPHRVSGLVRSPGSRISGRDTIYPLLALAAGIEGAVSLKLTVRTDGKVENIRVLSGPPELRKAAADAVSTWTYVPFQHLGQPVAEETTATINYNMGSDSVEKAQAQAKAKAELAEAEQKGPAPKS